MSPFASTRVIHPDWSGHHRPAAAGTMTAECTITTGGGGDWTPDDGPGAGTNPTTVHTGPCRVQALNSGANPNDAAGQVVAARPYLVAVETTAADIPVGARVTITVCVDDPHLVGKVLTVANPQYGSVLWQRDLLCDLDPTNQPGV